MSLIQFLAPLQPYTDLGIAIGGFALAAFVLPTLLNRKSQVPRFSSIPTAAILSYLFPLFLVSGLQAAAYSILIEAIIWWGIVTFRPVRKTYIGKHIEVIQ